MESKQGPHELVPILLIAATIGLVFVEQVTFAFKLKNDVSQGVSCIDANTEADTIRGGEGYAANGFLKHAALPDLNYGDKFPGWGVKRELGLNLPPGVPKPECIYTHQPPGALLIAGVVTTALGRDCAFEQRLLAIACGTSALVVLAVALVRRLGRNKAAAVLALFLAPPIARELIHALDCQTYAATFYVIELALLATFFDERSPKARAIGLAIAGFVVGWMLYDSFFVVALSGLAFALIAPRERVTRERLALAVIAPTAGFVLAGGLHFLQVAIELGGVGAALNEFRSTALYRVSGAGADIMGAGRAVQEPTMELRLPQVLWIFWQKVIPYRGDRSASGGFFAFDLTTVLLAVSVLPLFGKIKLGRVSWTCERRRAFAAAGVVAWLIAALWIVVMRQHSVVHPNYAVAKFVLPWLVMLLVVVDPLAISAPSARREPREQDPAREA